MEIGRQPERGEGKQSNGGERVWLFLDYDGTLAPFAPHPGVIEPDAELIALMGRLASQPEHRRVVVLTGRMLRDIQALLPARGVLLAASYGIEMVGWDEGEYHLPMPEEARGLLEGLKEAWAQLIHGKVGFYLEDKGVALALHAKDAGEATARKVMLEAAPLARALIETGSFRVQGGHLFLEVAPIAADKGKAVRAILERYPWPGAAIIYVGDDDKDEPAFRVVNGLGGRTIGVGSEAHTSAAQERLEDYRAVRAWLERAFL